MDRLLFLITALSLLFVLWRCIDVLYPLLTVHAPLPRADGIVLLAGEFRNRVPEAVRLFHAGVSSRIVITNDREMSWSPQHRCPQRNIEQATELMVAQGAPRSALVPLPFAGSGTIYDALVTRDFVREQRLRSLVLVTSDYHGRRALWTFRHVFRNEGVTVGMVTARSMITECGGRWPRWQAFGLETLKLYYYVFRFKICRNVGMTLYGFEI